jgi:hypothetical protein
MPKQPKSEDRFRPNTVPEYTASNDFMKLEHIVSALEYLHKEAAQTSCQEIQMIVESTFKTVLAAYCLILRNHAQPITCYDRT